MTGKEKGAPTAEVFPELTRDVIDRMGNAKNARLREAMAIVIRHLHAIVREAKLTQGEWWQAIDFITRAGNMTSDSPGSCTLAVIDRRASSLPTTRGLSSRQRMTPLAAPLQSC